MKTTKRTHARLILAVAMTVAASEAFAKLPAPPPEDVAGIVQAWLDSSSQVKSFDAQILRRRYDRIFRVEHRALGRFYFERAEFWTLDLKTVQPPLAKPRKGFKILSESPATLTVADEKIIQVDHDSGTAYIFRRPPEPDESSETSFFNLWASRLLESIYLRTINNWSLVLPARETLDQFHISLIKSDDSTIHLEGIPKSGDWHDRPSSFQVILDRQRHLTQHLQVSDPHGEMLFVYSFRNAVINRRPADREQLRNPDLSEFEVHRTRSAREEQP